MAHVNSRATDHDDEEDEYVKPPMSRGKKVLLGLFLFVALMIVIHWSWGRKSGNSLKSQVAQYRARGEPVLIEDFATPALSYEQNAATDILAAIALLTLSADEQKLLNKWDTHVDLTPEQTDALRRMVKDYQTALDEVAKARGKPDADWGVKFQSPLISVLLPQLNKQREIAHFTMMAADLAHRDGDDATALRLLDDVQTIGDAVGSSSVLVSHLVAQAISTGLPTEFVFRNAHELKVEGDATTPTGKDAKREDVEKLIRRLLDDSKMRLSLRRAFYGERAMQFDTVEMVAQGKLNIDMLGGPAGPRAGGAGNFAFVGPLLKPVLYRDALFMLRMTTRAMEAADEPNVDVAREKADFGQIMQLRGNPLHIMSSLLLPAFEAVVERNYRSITARRIAATLLALRLYQIDHAGKLPDTFDQLVPKYLPALPADPFSPDNHPLRYVTQDETVAVYGLGTNSKDDGGDANPVRKTNSNAPQDPWNALDFVLPFLPGPRDEPQKDEESAIDPIVPETLPETRPAQTPQ